MKLKAIVFGADFRCNEATNHEKFRGSKHYPGDLLAGETFLFVSRSGNQLCWILKLAPVTGGRSVIDSRKWRMTGGTWNPMLMTEYAAAAGVELVGMRDFKEQYEEQRRRKRLKLVA